MVGEIFIGKLLKQFIFSKFAVFAFASGLPTAWRAIAHRPVTGIFGEAPDLSLLRRPEMPRAPRVPFARRIL
jgi:hypothetical protein